jgi:hypothetical protein
MSTVDREGERFVEESILFTWAEFLELFEIADRAVEETPRTILFGQGQAALRENPGPDNSRRDVRLSLGLRSRRHAWQAHVQRLEDCPSVS